jgi:hypothetical protein
MENNLNEFIRTHRQEFDDQEPADRVWRNIRKSLFKKRSLFDNLSFWRAAAIVFMVTTAGLLIQRLGDTENGQVSLREFQDVEVFYNNQIAAKFELIETSSDADGLLNGFTKDFQHLEAMYQVLKEEMKARPSKRVGDALVLNLLIRIDLLNQQLQKLDAPRTAGEEVKTSI